MNDEELEKLAVEYATEDLPDGYTRINLQKKNAFIAGAKIMQAKICCTHETEQGCLAADRYNLIYEELRKLKEQIR
jgi:hypothetical protein